MIEELSHTSADHSCRAKIFLDRVGSPCDCMGNGAITHLFGGHFILHTDCKPVDSQQCQVQATSSYQKMEPLSSRVTFHHGSHKGLEQPFRFFVLTPLSISITC